MNYQQQLFLAAQELRNLSGMKGCLGGLRLPRHPFSFLKCVIPIAIKPQESYRSGIARRQ